MRSGHRKKPSDLLVVHQAGPFRIFQAKRLRDHPLGHFLGGNGEPKKKTADLLELMVGCHVYFVDFCFRKGRGERKKITFFSKRSFLHCMTNTVDRPAEAGLEEVEEPVALPGQIPGTKQLTKCSDLSAPNTFNATNARRRNTFLILHDSLL